MVVPSDQVGAGFCGRIRSVTRLLLTVPIWIYQRLISPAFPARCIYTPSCSEYTRIAILRHGLTGLVLGVFRVLRCAGGLYTGGEDAVPDRVTLTYLFGSFRRFWRRRGTGP